MTTSTDPELLAAAQAYFDAFYDSNVDRMREIFHPSCRLFSNRDNTLQDEDLETYLARVAARPSPRSIAQPRMDKILWIDKSAPECATIKSQAARLPRLYTDYITLLKIDGAWRVMSKTFTWELLPDAEG